MKLSTTSDKPLHIRVKYNGSVVYDQKHPAGDIEVDAQHPKDSGLAEAFIVNDDGSETSLGSCDYGPSED